MKNNYKIINIVFGIIMITLVGYIAFNKTKEEPKECEKQTCNCPIQTCNCQTQTKETTETTKKEIERDENGNRIIKDYYSSDQVGHTDNDYVGLFSATVSIESPENLINSKYDKVYYYLFLNDDGTFIYDAANYIGFYYWGNYILEEDQIILNVLFKGGHEPTIKPYFHTSTLKIVSSDKLIDTNIVEYAENIGTKEVTLERLNDQNRIDHYLNNFRDALENYRYLNDPMI